MDDMQRFINEHNLRLREGAQGFMSREFSKHEWAAPAIQEADIFKKYCHHLGLMGATIEEITTVGFGVGPIDGYSISHFCTHKRHPENKTSIDVDACLCGVDHVNLIMNWYLCPIVLVTDKGKFEIDFTESSTVYMGKDSIPTHYYGASEEELEQEYLAKELFSGLQGDTVVDCLIDEQTFEEAACEFTGACNMTLPYGLTSYIKNITFCLESGRKIRLSTFWNNGMIEVLDKEDRYVQIPADHLKRCLPFA